MAGEKPGEVPWGWGPGDVVQPPRTCPHATNGAVVMVEHEVPNVQLLASGRLELPKNKRNAIQIPIPTPINLPAPCQQKCKKFVRNPECGPDDPPVGECADVITAQTLLSILAETNSQPEEEDE